jgi:hypothetical protein
MVQKMLSTRKFGWRFIGPGLKELTANRTSFGVSYIIVFRISRLVTGRRFDSAELVAGQLMNKCLDAKTNRGCKPLPQPLNL